MPVIRNRKTADVASFFLLAVLTLLLRLPWFFPSVIDWDESTFILLGQSLLDGNLPYVELWDLKPPLAFAFFSLFILLFGNDIIGIRISGAILVFLTACLIYLAGKAFRDRNTGLYSAVLTVLFVSFAESGQATLTETIIIAPLSLVLLLLLKDRYDYKDYLAMGLLISIATLVRMNLAYLAVVLGIYLVLHSILIRKQFFPVVMYVFSGLIPVTLLFLIYALDGHMDLLVQSMIEAPLAYSGNRYSPVMAFLHQGYGVLTTSLLFTGVLSVFGLYLFAREWMTFDTGQRRRIIIIITFTGGILLSIICSGAAHRHYMIQLVPFMCLISGYVLARPGIKSWFIPVFSILFVISMYSPGSRLAVAYSEMMTSLWHGESLQSDHGYKLAEYLKAENPGQRPVYLMNFHIVYWLTGTKPISRLTTHPSNISKIDLLEILDSRHTSPVYELSNIFAKKPEFVVKTDDLWYLEEWPEAVRFIDKALEEYYVLVQRFGKVKVYRRQDY